MQRLAGGVQLCTQKDIKTRECTCGCGSIVRQCFVWILLRDTQSEEPIPTFQGEVAGDVKVRGAEVRS